MTVEGFAIPGTPVFLVLPPFGHDDAPCGLPGLSVSQLAWGHLYEIAS